MNKDQQTQIEAAAFRSLIEHLRHRSDVQNIDLMNLAGFCRNCLSKWYAAAAQTLGSDIDYATAQQHIYGTSIEEWKAKHQTPATAEQKQKFEESKTLHAKIHGYKPS